MSRGAGKEVEREGGRKLGLGVRKVDALSLDVILWSEGSQKLLSWRNFRHRMRGVPRFSGTIRNRKW